MRRTLIGIRLLAGLFAGSLAGIPAGAAAPAAAAELRAGEARVTTVFDHPLPTVPGKSLRGVLVEYGPGGSSPAHRHAASAFITATVIEGAIRSRVNDGPERVYRAGESFVEQPGDHHAVSANASTTQASRLLAVFVVDTEDRALTVPDRP
ncbi:Cupin domain protein [Methylobacterium sp. 174MFSha1.1]|uniref:cupin domain-containing protein n=1 Tax=Methylobacterium sp. 174MFSha1.1 TaxID=1502749 RepID=UPI0008F3CC07|nr:cupin domain-containing protein [Methylobacterium sp. 174MFSha1.1]SFV06734.1 Cupin domain protein [Methylobacterium sp. 174MFSha1.1]